MLIPNNFLQQRRLNLAAVPPLTVVKVEEFNDDNNDDDEKYDLHYVRSL